MNNIEYKSKVCFRNNFHQIIKNHRNDFHTYFVTFTFGDLKSSYTYEDYRIYFKYMFQRLNNSLALNSHSYKKSPRLILIPEEHPALHFHGYMLIHKETSIRFNKKCVSNLEFDKRRNKVTHVLDDKIIDPYPSWMRVNQIKNFVQGKFLRQMPTLCSHKIYYIGTNAEIEKSCLYSCKKFASSSFEIDHLIEHIKMKPVNYIPACKKDRHDYVSA